MARVKPSEDRNDEADDCSDSRHYRGDFRPLVGSPLCGLGGLILLVEPSIRKMRVIAELVGRGDKHADFPFPHLLKAGPPLIVDLTIFGHTGANSLHAP